MLHSCFSAYFSTKGENAARLFGDGLVKMAYGVLFLIFQVFCHWSNQFDCNERILISVKNCSMAEC